MKKEISQSDRSSIRKKFFVFISYFIVLCSLVFLSLYFVFKSYEIQKSNIQTDIVAYKEMLNKQQVLKAKIDTIYYQMSLINTGKVKNDLFLGNYISQNIQETKIIIGTDSVSAFKHYAVLLNKLDSILVLKNNITVISDKERLALKDLNECIGKITKVKSELSKDPTRGFQTK